MTTTESIQLVEQAQPAGDENHWTPEDEFEPTIVRGRE